VGREIIGLQVVVSGAISPSLIETLTDLVDLVISRLDPAIAEAALEFKPGEPATAEALARCYDEVLKARKALPKDAQPLLTAAPRATS
jgi:hypothetical protein